jgi:hypothetical protein
VQKPKVTDARLHNLVNDLYHGEKAANRVGDGSTADAIRYEKQTGRPVGGRWHIQKGQEYLGALNAWLRKNGPTASASDVKAAQDLIADLSDALK